MEKIQSFPLRFIPPQLISSKSHSSLRCTSSRPADSKSPGGNRIFIGDDLVRRWVVTDVHTSLRFQEKFTVVSWNVLADRNAFKHRDSYRNVPFAYLKWNYRKMLIYHDLIEWDPDIICLQEVDRYYDLLTIMEKGGYVGSYKRRTGDTVDGCAMFWKAEKFRLLEEESIQFNQFGLRDNVAQLCVFEADAECCCKKSTRWKHSCALQSKPRRRESWSSSSSSVQSRFPLKEMGQCTYCACWGLQ